jgi:hypothetical protein
MGWKEIKYTDEEMHKKQIDMFLHFYHGERADYEIKCISEMGYVCEFYEKFARITSPSNSSYRLETKKGSNLRENMVYIIQLFWEGYEFPGENFIDKVNAAKEYQTNFDKRHKDVFGKPYDSEHGGLYRKASRIIQQYYDIILPYKMGYPRTKFKSEKYYLDLYNSKNFNARDYSYDCGIQNGCVSSAYTTFGIDQIVSSLSKAIQNYGHGDTSFTYGVLYETILRNPHIHEVIKFNLIQNLDNYKKSIDEKDKQLV